MNSFIDAYTGELGAAGAYALYLHLQQHLHLNMHTEIRELPQGYMEWRTADNYTVKLQEYRFEYEGQQVTFWAGAARVTNTLYWWKDDGKRNGSGSKSN